MTSGFAVIFAIVIVVAGLSLCCWAYADWLQLFGARSTPRSVCVYDNDDDIQRAEVIYDPNKPGNARCYHKGQQQVQYFLVPGGAITRV